MNPEWISPNDRMPKHQENIMVLSLGEREPKYAYLSIYPASNDSIKGYTFRDPQNYGVIKNVISWAYRE
jgi:hypothetical protein